jgi:phospholipid/cholesterol/gamma-HCH transport system substrate-binding protein
VRALSRWESGSTVGRNKERRVGQAHLGRRIVALVAVAAAIVVVAVLLLTRGSAYTVDVQFQNASQLVKGNLVEVAGANAGTVKDITLTDDGQARVKLEITKDYAPLRRGTRAIVRQASLSGVANRYVDLQLGDGTSSDIADGGRIESSETQSAVDLDQIFNTFDPVARTAVQRDFRGFGEMYAGRSEQANEAFKRLSPALASSSTLFRELDRNSGYLDRFVVQTAKLVGDVAERRNDLAGVVDHLATTSSALAAQRSALGQSINELPTFMRKTNTTFVNLRAALDDLDPLVAESRPTIRKLRPFLRQLRPFAREAVPTVRDLSRTIRQPGADNDLVELLNAQPAVDQAANQPVQANGKQREGAFPAMSRAAQGSIEQLSFARPYAPDLIGWFDDFSESGAYDALGGFSRAGLALNAFTFTPAAGGGGSVLPIPPALRDQLTTAIGQISKGQGTEAGRNNRCAGSSERSVDGSNPISPPSDNPCNPAIKPIGP